MDTRTFLSRVSAPTDNLVISLWKPDPQGKDPRGIFWNRGSFADLDDAVAAIQMWDRDPDWTVFYSVGRMADNAVTKDDGSTGYTRKKSNATWFKAVCFDLDIGGKYPAQKDGHKALMDAVQALQLPAPMVVSSGRGIHYYWPLINAVTKQEWEEVSIALRLALAEQKVEIDNSKIHDASMVLRPVGTSHKKQIPWRLVTLMADSPDYDIADLRQPLSQWIGLKQAAKASAPKPTSITSAILRNCNLDIRAIARKCNQVAAMLASGGEFDAAGTPVLEPLWRLALGLAAYAVDQEEAMLLLCAQHPDFDHAANMAKMSAWGTPPPTCAAFEALCPAGCVGCSYKGVVSPVSLNEEAASLPPGVSTLVAVEQADESPMFQIPEGYYISSGKVYTDIDVDVKDKDAAGNTVTKTIKQKTLVCPYEMHLIGMYAEFGLSASTARIAVKYPHDGWKSHDIATSLVQVGGRDFAAWMGDRQIYLSTEATTQRTRTFLMTYLAKAQALVPSGVDFKRFGWQEDGSFLCGEEIIGTAARTAMKRRLKGTAAQYSDKVRKHGDRNVWADITKYIDHPKAEFLGVGLLTACMGALGNISGNATPIISFYSINSGTGKTLSLAIGQSAFMNPSDKHMLQPKDTDNSIYHALGVLGDLSGAMDEMTVMDDDKRAVDMAYVVSQGRERGRMTKEIEARELSYWNAPMRVSSNKSLYDMYDMVSAKNEGVKMRTFQFNLDGREFVDKYGVALHVALGDNYGHAMSELVAAVLHLGGKRVVWEKGLAAFEKKFRFTFQAEERFFKNTCVACYTLGMIGVSLDLFRFDLDRIINYMLARVVELRNQHIITTTDGFDIIGQFMQEYNHQIIVSRKENVPGGQPKIQIPTPENASIRLDILYDNHTAVLKGSVLYINASTLRSWLRRNKDSMERLLAELHAMGALLARNQRVTMFKGCQMINPGQAYCIAIDLTHPRMAVTLNGSRPIPITSPAAAVLQPVTSSQHP